MAVLTMVRDEATMLPRWLAHYGSQVGVSNLVVVDDGSTDGSTQGLPCPVIRIPPLTKHPFESSRMRLVSSIAAGLLQAYDAVVFCDADEFVVADPARYRDLPDYVAAHPEQDVAAVVGLNVVHHVGAEPPLDPAAPILGQRRLATLLPKMCKPALKTVPSPWVNGSHGIRHPYRVDPDLWMFHMKFADRDHLRATARHRRGLVEIVGRAPGTNWAAGPDRLVRLLEEVTAGVDPAGVADLRPEAEPLERLVEPFGNGGHHAVGGQVSGMRTQPLVRVPDRFVGVV